MRVVVDAKAWTDLNQIGAWIAKDNPQAAREVLRGILAMIAQLERFPRLARPGCVDGTYERVVPGTRYIIVFELWNEPQPALVVTAVAHGRRNR
jgi:toxin ParE1/3/4